MINLNKFVINDKAIKESCYPIIQSYVASLIRHTELARIQNKPDFRKAKAALYDAHAEIDILTYGESF